MTTKKHQRRNVRIVCRSPHFWRGFVDGFASPGFLTIPCKYRAVVEKENSVYDAWKEVGDLLTDAMTEYRIHERPTAQATATERKRERELTRAH
jgi:hypothetical protein